jgi:hypothetical protein
MEGKDMKIIKIKTCGGCPEFFHCDFRNGDYEGEIPKECPLEDDASALPSALNRAGWGGLK